MNDHLQNLSNYIDSATIALEDAVEEATELGDTVVVDAIERMLVEVRGIDLRVTSMLRERTRTSWQQ